VFELACHFRRQYAWILVACAVALAAAKHPLDALIAASLALLNVERPPRGTRPSPARRRRHGPVYRALLANVLFSNRRYERLISLAQELQPDLMLLQEVDEAWVRALDSLAGDYPLRHAAARRDGFGLMLLSRLPCQSARTIRVGPYDVPSVLAELGLGGPRLCVVGTHPFAPTSARRAWQRREHLRALAQLARSRAGPTMVLADLNTTSHSPLFRDLLRESGLRDSRQGFGVQASWPVHLPPLRIAIDHCLVSPEISIVHRRLGPSIGSDHLPVVVDFCVDPPA